MDRTEFKKYACDYFKIKSTEADQDKDYWYDIILNDEEPFWIPEYRDGWKAQHFIVSKNPIELTITNKGWVWCQDHLSKIPLCFMSGKEDWWGFNTEEDAVLFVMKFA